MLLLPPTINNTFLLLTTLATTMRPITFVSNETDTTIDPFAGLVNTTHTTSPAMVSHPTVITSNISVQSKHELKSIVMDRGLIVDKTGIPTTIPRLGSLNDSNMPEQITVSENDLKNIVLLREQLVDTANMSPIVISIGILVVIVLLGMTVRWCLKRREGLRLAYEAYNQAPNVRSIGWSSVFIPSNENGEVENTSNLDRSVVHDSELVDLNVSETGSGIDLPIVTIIPPIPPPQPPTLPIVTIMPTIPPPLDRKSDHTRTNLSEANQRIQSMLEEQLSSIYSSR